MDALLRAVLHQTKVRNKRVALDLVGRRSHTGSLDDGLKHLHGEIGDADGLRLALGELEHGLPSVDERYVHVEVDLVVVLLRHEHAAILLERYRPVDEVELFESAMESPESNGWNSRLGSQAGALSGTRRELGPHPAVGGRCSRASRSTFH